MMRDNDDNEALLPNEESSEMRATAPSLSQIVISGDGTENTDISEDVGLPWGVVEIRERLRHHQEAQPDRDDVDYLLSVIQNLVNPIIQPPASAVVVAVDDQNPGEVRKTTPCYSSVVDQSHLQLDADQSKAWDFTAAAIRYGREKERERCAKHLERIASSMIMPSIRVAVRDCAAAIRSNSTTQDSASASELSTISPESLRPETENFCIGGYGWDDAHIIDGQGNKVIVVYRNLTTNESPVILAQKVVDALNTLPESSASSDVSEVDRLRAKNIVRELTERAKRTDCECEDLWCFHWEQEVAKAFDKRIATAFDLGLEEAAKIAENQWAMVSVGKVAIENQSEYERNAIAAAIRDRMQQNNLVVDSEDLVE